MPTWTRKAPTGVASQRTEPSASSYLVRRVRATKLKSAGMLRDQRANLVRLAQTARQELQARRARPGLKGFRGRKAFKAHRVRQAKQPLIHRRSTSLQRPTSEQAITRRVTSGRLV